MTQPPNKPETNSQRNARHDAQDATLTPEERTARDQAIQDIQDLDK